MITLDQAKAGVQRLIDRPDAPGEWRIFDDVMETPWGWVVFYAAADRSVPVAGNAPFLVIRDSGQYARFGTAWTVQQQVAALTAELERRESRWGLALRGVDRSNLRPWVQLRSAWGMSAPVMAELIGRCPGVVLRGARRDLEPLQAAAAAAGFEAELVGRPWDGPADVPEAPRSPVVHELLEAVELWPLPIT